MWLQRDLSCLATFTRSDRCVNYTNFYKTIEVCWNVFFKEIDISMEMINQKYENR